MEIERNKVVNIRNFIKVWEVVKGKNQQNNTLTNFMKWRKNQNCKGHKSENDICRARNGIFQKKRVSVSYLFLMCATL